MADTDAQSLVGTVIAGRYRLVSVLGAGAMGTVYGAEAVDDRTPLAVKLLRHHLTANPEAAARFRREALVSGKLDHPNCVAVCDFGTTDDGAQYLAMERLEGESLGELLAREGRLPWRRALRIARQVLRGLGHAHHAEIVHRDIKPDNIFLLRGGDGDTVKILDFGIAKLVTEGIGAGITQAGVAVGTPAYLSPEQALGGTLDGRSDLYSLSIVVFEMITGRTPFGGREALKTLFAHAMEAVPTFAEIAPDLAVPPAVEALVRDGLAKTKDDRIASAYDYVQRIDALLGTSRRRWLPWAGAGAAVVAAVTALALVKPWASAGHPPAPAMPRAVADAIVSLEHGKTCAIRLAAVKRLAALGDRAALPALQRVQAARRPGKDPNACLRTATASAIAKLQVLSR